MMRRMIIALVALLVAALGGVLTYLYATNADARAMARMEPVQVLVVAEPIPQGTAAEEIARSVAVTELPAAALVPGGVTDLADVAGMITATDLQPGEQLIASRFVAPEAVQGEVEVPADMHELSIQLEQQRVIGGELRPGDTVGVFISAEVISTTPEGVEQASSQITQLVLHKVLVTAVQGAASTTTDESGQETAQAAADSLTVTLALSPADAERVVFAQEFARIWLSLEGPEVPEPEARLVDADEVFNE